MTDFVIVFASALAGALSTPAADPAAAVPLNAPTLVFKVYRDVASCEQAVERLAAPAGKRFVCLPVGPEQELPTAY
jgi:hypothetical protein